MSPALEAQSLNHRTTREVPSLCFKALPISVRKKSESLLWPAKPHVILSPATSQTTAPTLPFALSAPVILASWALLKQTKKIPAPGPLHLLLPLPVGSFPRYLCHLLSYFMSMSAQMLHYLSTFLRNNTSPSTVLLCSLTLLHSTPHPQIHNTGVCSSALLPPEWSLLKNRHFILLTGVIPWYRTVPSTQWTVKNSFILIFELSVLSPKSHVQKMRVREVR